MWELPAFSGGFLEAKEALAKLREWGLTPCDMEKTLHYTHVFTHVEWRMRCYFIRCAAPAPGFTWAGPEELLARYPLPSALRPFIDALEKDEK